MSASVCLPEAGITPTAAGPSGPAAAARGASRPAVIGCCLQPLFLTLRSGVTAALSTHGVFRRPRLRPKLQETSEDRKPLPAVDVRGLQRSWGSYAPFQLHNRGNTTWPYCLPAHPCPIITCRWLGGNWPWRITALPFPWAECGAGPLLGMESVEARARWEEVSGYNEGMNPIHIYQVCNVRESSQNNWLRTGFIWQWDVQRVYVELKFTLPTSNVAFTSSHFWMENPYVKVDTIVPDESFSRLDAGHVNTKVRSFGPLSKAGFYLAFQDQGTCLLLISMCAFCKKCASTTAGFTLFPETLTGAEPTSLVIAPGTCIPNAMEVSVLLKLYCNGDGEGMVPVCACTCATGHEPAAKESQCHSCPPGSYKAKQGEGPCLPCPPNSQITSPAASICTCHNNFYHADSDFADCLYQ
ncbi:Ephrin type-B receptor 3 [Saguinus oedipus]|uniref:Ephrin type-B receptor 3 n=1 Tax=Saguinus oedipus TaxID=9490 RepID=A0ABQ9VFH9_SAGOE|nr:Ephrin type-B receptor 3 [Saguinus oedipus]